MISSPSDSASTHDEGRPESLSIGLVVFFYGLLSLGAWIWASSTSIEIVSHKEGLAIWWPLGLGFIVGGVGIVFWDLLASQIEALRALWRTLRTMIGPQSVPSVLVLALSSSIAEELFFRGAMQAHLGIAATAVIFGLLHGLPGTRFWIWGAFAIIAGLVFGVLYELSGGLLAPIVAHFTINAVNLYRLSRVKKGLV